MITQSSGVKLTNFDRLVLLVCVALASSCASPGVPRPTDGRVVGDFYENDYFGFTLPVPQGWHIAGVETIDALLETDKAFLETDPALEPKLEVSRSRTHHLVTLSEQPIGASVGSNPIINLLCENVRHAPGVRSGADYLYHLSRALQRSPIHVGTEDSYAVELGNRKFFRRDFLLADGGIQSYIARRDQDYVLGFILTADNETQLEELFALVSEIRFRPTP